MSNKEATAEWTTAWPTAEDRFYWMRWLDERYRDLPVHVQGIHVMCLFDHSYLQRGDLEGSVQFLGPITPGQLNERDALLQERDRLREAAKAAIEVLKVEPSIGRETAIIKLRAALSGKEGEGNGS